MKVYKDVVMACARCHKENPSGRISFLLYDPEKPDRPYCMVHGENFRLTSKEKTIIFSRNVSKRTSGFSGNKQIYRPTWNKDRRLNLPENLA